MKKQIRRCVFETNSSMTHALTIFMKDDWEKYKSGDYYVCTDSFGFEIKPEKGKLYSYDEVLDFLKYNKYFDKSNIDNEDYIRDWILGCFENYDDRDDEYYYDINEFTTSSGEEIVILCKYGNG